MKMTPELQMAQRNMQPGVISGQGFLGEDQRPLIDIITEDEERLAKSGKSFDDLYQRMEHFMIHGRKGLGEPIGVEDEWEVWVDEARGKLVCPFQDGVYAKVNVRVCRISTQECVTYSELALHLIHEHHFFQGNPSSYRLDPEELVRVLF